MDGDYGLAPTIRVQPLWGAERHLSKGEGFEADSINGSANAYAVWMMLTGAVEIRMHGKRFLVREAEVFLHVVTEPRSVMAPLGAEWLSVGLQITLPGAQAAFSEGDLPSLWRPDAQNYQDMLACMGVLSRGIQGVLGAAPIPLPRPSPRPADLMLQESVARALFFVLWRQWNAKKRSGTALFDTPPHLAHALRKLQEEPQTSVEELARSASVSVAQFRRQFHRWFGMAPHRYIDSHRLAVARHLLAATKLSVSEVAIRSGFENGAHFSRAFKKARGVTPTQFRRIAQGSASL